MTSNCWRSRSRRGPVLVSDEEARAAAQEILAQHQFTRWDGDFETWLRAFEGLIDLVPSGLIDALRWLQEMLIEKLLVQILSGLARFLNLFGVFGESSTVLGWLAVCLLVAAAIVLAYRIWGAEFFDSVPETEGRRSSRTHSESIADARAVAAEGHFLEAAHRVQLATLAMLIEFDWLELARSDPNRTLRQRVANSSLPERERAKLIALVDRLEALWFDEPRDDRELFEEWLALDDRLFRGACGGAA
jgi:hypothetical protein